MREIRSELLARAHNTVPIIRTEVSFALSKSETCSIRLPKFPIKLVWAGKIRKVKDQTLENLCVLFNLRFNLSKQKTFGNSQI